MARGAITTRLKREPLTGLVLLDGEAVMARALLAPGLMPEGPTSLAYQAAIVARACILPHVAEGAIVVLVFDNRLVEAPPRRNIHRERARARKAVPEPSVLTPGACRLADHWRGPNALELRAAFEPFLYAAVKRTRQRTILVGAVGAIYGCSLNLAGLDEADTRFGRLIVALSAPGDKVTIFTPDSDTQVLLRPKIEPIV